MVADSGADRYNHGFGTETERFRNGKKFSQIGMRNVHYQPTKLKIITLQLNNLTKLYSIVSTMTIQASFCSTDELHNSLTANFALLV